MKKEELQKEIQKIDQQISELETVKKEFVTELLGLDSTKGQKIQNILDYGGHNYWLIDYTRGGILEKYIADHDRHTTIEMDGIMDGIYGMSYYASTLEEQKEVFEMFGIEEEVTQEMFDNARESKYTYEHPMKDFEDLWDDIVKAGVKSFTVDW